MKYGWGLFRCEILESNLSREEASEKEKYYIELYNTINNEYGYNITTGGDNNFIRRPLTLEQRQKVSETTKKAMNELNRRSHMLRVYKSEDWLKKNSDATKKQWRDSNLREKVVEANGTKVRCIETDKTYNSILEASKDTGISRYKIGESCKREDYNADNTHWEYV